MKTKNYQLFISLLIGLILYISCNKDDEKKTKGTFIYDGIEYTFEGGHLEYWDESTDSHNILLRMYTPDASEGSSLGIPFIIAPALFYSSISIVAPSMDLSLEVMFMTMIGQMNHLQLDGDISSPTLSPWKMLNLLMVQ